MKQEALNTLMNTLQADAIDVHKTIMENDGVMKEPGEMPVTQAIKVYTRRRDHLSEKGNTAGAKQLTDLLKNLSTMPNSNITLLSMYFDFGGFTVFTSRNVLLGMYNVETTTTEAIEFLQRSKAAGSDYPKLYKISNGRVGEIIE
jgi:hypothetical protein